MAERLIRLDWYQQIPVRPMLDWGLPTWGSDPHFDPRRHLHHVRVPSSGDGIAFARLVDDLFSAPLPVDRSPWDMTLVRGLSQERSALVARVHHCMIDGVSGAQVLEAIVDPHDHGTPPPPPSRTSRQSTWVARLGDALASIDLHTLAEVGSTIASFVREPVSALPFNASLSPARRVVWSSFPLGEFLAVRGAVGCKINDAVLAVIAGALRRYLQSHDLSTEGLCVRAGIPVSVRRDEDHLSLGNLVSAVFPRLPVDVPDPLDRLRRVAHEMNAIKTRQQAQATGILLGILGSLPPPVEALVGRLVPDTAIVNTICTNVPGPRTSGARSSASPSPTCTRSFRSSRVWESSSPS